MARFVLRRLRWVPSSHRLWHETLPEYIDSCSLPSDFFSPRNSGSIFPPLCIDLWTHLSSVPSFQHQELLHPNRQSTKTAIMSIKTLFAASVLAASHVVNAAVLPIRQTATDGLTCADKAVGATFSTKLASNSQFDITCGADYYGNDLNNGLRWPGSFQGCLDTCDAEPLCSTVAYVDGACYLKQGVPTLQTGNDAVWSAKKTPPPTCDGSSNSDGTIYSTSAGSFQIICGKDYGGNDLGGVNTGSFSACIDLCATTNNCVDVS